MGRRRRGLQHMILTKDKLLVECCPSDTTISWEDYMIDCKKAVNTSALHSDEWSTDDENLAKGEIEQKKRPERLSTNNSVIKIHDKKWRSTRVCKIFEIYTLYT